MLPSGKGPACDWRDTVEGGELSGFCDPRKLGAFADRQQSLHVPFRNFTMDDTRCCGTGTCIINDEGFCWCGQQWNGERMCFPERPSAPPYEAAEDRAGSTDSAEGSGD